MATVLDEFTVQVGLDSSKFTEGERDVLQSFEKTKDRATEFGKTIEEQGTKMADVFSVVKKGAAGILGAFVGGETMSFINRVADMDAATSRMARSISMNTENLSTWQGMVRQMGGTAESATSTIATLTDSLTSITMGGQLPSPGFATLMARAGIRPGMGADQSLRQISQFLQQEQEAGRMSARQARFFLEQVPGMNQDMMNLLLKGPKAMDDFAEAARKAGIATKESGEQAEDYQRKVSLLDQALQNLARVTFPSMTAAVNATTGVLESKAGGWIASILAGAGVGAVTGGLLGSVIPGPGTFLGAGSGAIAGGIAGAITYGTSGPSTPSAPPTPPHESGILSMWGMRLTQGSRGDRNNNPGNIEYGPFAIAHGATGSDGRFAIFPDMATGAAAMANLLAQHYAGKTLADIQKTWVGNEDPAYLKSMMAATGLGANDVPDLTNPSTMAQLLRGMSGAEGTHIDRAAARATPAARATINHNNSGGNRTSSTNIGTINLISNKADPKEVAMEIPDVIRRGKTTAGMDSGLV